MCTSYMLRDMLQGLVLYYEGNMTHDNVYTMHIKRIAFNDL
jgi:hypothetical protein